MNTLITGGAGFIGSNFILYYLKNHPEYNVFCVDALTYAGNILNIENALNNNNFSFKQIDICDKEGIKKLFKQYKFDVVINFAAETHVDRSIISSEEFVHSNVEGVQVLLDVCRENGIKRFHQVSTDEVYGDKINCVHPFNESSLLVPSSPYSATKAAADLLVISYGRTFKIPISISRCSNNYGKNQFPEKLIPKTIINALKDKPIPLYGSGKNKRNWINVIDHCKAIDLIVHSSDSEGEIYNVGSEEVISNNDVVQTILTILKKPKTLIEYVPDRLGHDFEYSINCEKIKKKLLWSPTVDFNEGIIETINWYIQNMNRWK